MYGEGISREGTLLDYGVGRFNPKAVPGILTVISLDRVKKMRQFLRKC